MAASDTAILNLIPCDTDLTSTSGTSSSFCSSTLPYLHEYEYNNSKVEVENGLTVYGYISALAAKSRLDAISADPIFQHGLFAIRTSERLQDSRRQQGQQTPESPVETCKGNMATTSMELVDSKGASSPTFQTLTSSGNTSTTIPNNSCNKPDLLKIVPRRNPHACPTTIDTFVPGLTNPAANADPNHINFNESVAAAAEAMDRIRERVAAKEVEVQLEYLGRSSLLLQMLLRDKGKVCSTNNHSIRVGGVEDRSNDGDTSSDMETDGSVGSFSSLYDFESIDDRELFVL
ncbi:hypothetical protein BGX29_010442 [Mortierella sp. GBA35]|nr:hypothetical protein BGX29_010442 [Mortierella sp. GBA35]